MCCVFEVQVQLIILEAVSITLIVLCADGCEWVNVVGEVAGATGQQEAHQT